MGWLVCALDAATLTAKLDRDIISVGESATLSLEFQGGSPSAAPNLAGPQGLAIQYAGQSSQYNIVNGQVSASVSLNYLITAQRVGDYAIPAIQVQVGGQVLTSQPLKLRVVKSDVPTVGGNNSSLQVAFLKLWVPKNEVYLGEVLPIEIRLYCHGGQRAQEPQVQPLQSDGFTVGKSIPPQQTQVQFSNQVYNLVFYKLSVTPVRTGKLTLGPAEGRLTLLIPQNNPRPRRDPFDLFGSPFDPFGPRMEARPLSLTSEPQTLTVLPLPTENVPPGFNGAVGNFSLSAHAGPTNVAVGDPITVKVQVTGRGSWDTLTLPATEWGQNFKAYPPTSKFESNDPLGLEGTKTFEYVITPQMADIKAMPPVSFSFFDPEQKAYRNLQPSAIPLVVRPTAASTMPPSLAGNPGPERQNAPLPQDIINIKARLGMVTAIQPPLARQSWFIALQGVPLLTWLLVFGWRKYAENLSRNPRLRRQRTVERLIANGLRDLRRQADGQEAEAFYATVFRLLQERLGERLDRPASSMTESVLEEQLRPQGVPEETLSLLHDLFQRCNQARYAPMPMDKELRQLLPKVEAALESLRSLKPNLS